MHRLLRQGASRKSAGCAVRLLEDLLDATNYALVSCGYPERTLAQLRAVVGNGAENQIRKSLPEGTPEPEVQRVLGVYKPYYTAHCQEMTRPYAGIPEALTYLKTRYPIAIVSNKPDSAVKALCADYFPGIYALGEAAGCPRKPAADMVFKAMKDLGVEDCIYVGDSEVDILTAENAGASCVCVLWGFRNREELQGAGEARYCETPEKLAEIIEELIHGK